MHWLEGTCTSHTSNKRPGVWYDQICKSLAHHSRSGAASHFFNGATLSRLRGPPEILRPVTSPMLSFLWYNKAGLLGYEYQFCLAWGLFCLACFGTYLLFGFYSQPRLCTCSLICAFLAISSTKLVVLNDTHFGACMEEKKNALETVFLKIPMIRLGGNSSSLSSIRKVLICC